MSPGIPTRLLATQSDERLLALVRQGHERAFEALVQRYRKPLLSYCRRLSLSHTRAEDIVQLALLKTWIAVREDAEVRDLKAWLYRVVHNTAVNALRDAAHDGEPLADPALAMGSNLFAADSQLDRGLAMRETLAEVAALPPLQREVIVRTAVAGHSHEQVASDLGITHGAVRGLLYRARATLRTAITALTPPPLLAWLAGRSDQSTPAPERLTELASGGGAAGLGGLLLKGGVVALTAGTVAAGAAVVHSSESTHHRARHEQPAAAPADVSDAASSPGEALLSAQSRGISLTRSRAPRDARSRGARPHRELLAGLETAGGGGSTKGSVTVPASGHQPQSPAGGDGHGGTPGTVQIVVHTDTPPSGSGQGSSPAAGPSQGSGEAGAGSSEPVGSAAGNGSSGGSEAGSSGTGSAEGSGSPPGGDQSGAGSGSGGSGSSEGSDKQENAGGQSPAGGSSGSEPTSGSDEEHSGSLVGTVVHEVGSILEHVLH
jgi:RNA polymerase sigma factor (sigma-70 family)